MSTPAGPPEFSREIPLAEFETAPAKRRLEADAAERAGLAARLGLDEIPALACDLRFRRLADQRTFEVSGVLDAEVVQRCVVTLEPFAAAVRDSFSLRFARIAPAAELDLDVEDDAPEPVEGDLLDLGEIVAQQLSLALDPYPRKPGAAIPDDILDTGEAADPAGPTARNPFAKLAELKHKA